MQIKLNSFGGVTTDPRIRIHYPRNSIVFVSHFGFSFSFINLIL